MKSLIEVYIKNYEFYLKGISDIKSQVDVFEFRDMKQLTFAGKISLEVGSGKLDRSLTSELMQRSNLKEIIRSECVKLIPENFLVSELLSNNYEKKAYYIPLNIKVRSNKKVGNCIEVEFNIDSSELNSFVDGITHFSCKY